MSYMFNYASAFAGDISKRVGRVQCKRNTTLNYGTWFAWLFRLVVFAFVWFISLLIVYVLFMFTCFLFVNLLVLFTCFCLFAFACFVSFLFVLSVCLLFCYSLFVLPRSFACRPKKNVMNQSFSVQQWYFRVGRVQRDRHVVHVQLCVCVRGWHFNVSGTCPV